MRGEGGGGGVAQGAPLRRLDLVTSLLHLLRRDLVLLLGRQHSMSLFGSRAALALLCAGVVVAGEQLRIDAAEVALKELVLAHERLVEAAARHARA